MTKTAVLVVDDDPFNLHIIGEFLADLELDLSFAESGEQGWSLLDAASAHYDVVILDRMMPGMSGIELLQRIKAEPRFAHLPVIMQTAAAAPDQVREGIVAGAYYYLTKPFEPEALQTIVRAALRDKSERAATEDANTCRQETLHMLTDAAFQLRNLDQARQLSSFLGALCPNPTAAVIGVSELLVNAIEHGNLGITYAEKSALRLADSWDAEVSRRLALPEYRERRVQVKVERTSACVRITVSDEGNGFDWMRYLDFDPLRACDPNGRGIALARQLSFTSIEYMGRGNIVVATASQRAVPIPDASEATGVNAGPWRSEAND